MLLSALASTISFGFQGLWVKIGLTAASNKIKKFRDGTNPSNFLLFLNLSFNVDNKKTI